MKLEPFEEPFADVIEQILRPNSIEVAVPPFEQVIAGADRIDRRRRHRRIAAATAAIVIAAATALTIAAGGAQPSGVDTYRPPSTLTPAPTIDALETPPLTLDQEIARDAPIAAAHGLTLGTPDANGDHPVAEDLPDLVPVVHTLDGVYSVAGYFYSRDDLAGNRTSYWVYAPDGATVVGVLDLSTGFIPIADNPDPPTTLDSPSFEPDDDE